MNAIYPFSGLFFKILQLQAYFQPKMVAFDENKFENIARFARNFNENETFLE